MSELSSINRVIASRIIQARTIKGLTQDDLSRRMNVSRPLIAMIESGASGVTIGKLYLFAEALDIEPHDLLPKLSEFKNLVSVRVGNRTFALTPDEAARLRQQLNGESEAGR